MRNVNFWFGTTRSGSIFCSCPIPPQVGHAPNGLLNEKSLGSISVIVKPETGQANFDEKEYAMQHSGLKCLDLRQRELYSYSLAYLHQQILLQQVHLITQAQFQSYQQASPQAHCLQQYDQPQRQYHA